ncbi:MAG: hypothetical protein SFU85_08135 [Candidatus Methylacidiphilales bacterium]|nr:hypothetical protein [Candidatus Methylacidiphilales bacterium]
MLRDAPIRPVANDLPRKWLMDDYLELVVWYAPEGNAAGFELIYDRMNRPRSIRWLPGQEARHYAVDGGEDNPGKNRSPMLLADGAPDLPRIREEFSLRSRDLPQYLQEFVSLRLASLSFP